MRTSTSLALVAAGALAALGCSPTVHHARLGEGGGIAEGAAVMVSGVRVGRVQSVRVVESSVDVGFVFEGDHQVTLRADTCAMGVAAEGGSSLVIVPGVQAPIAEERAIPQCQLPAAGLDDVMRTFGEELDSVMRAIQQSAHGGQAPQGAPPPQG
ncbi:MAG: MCE family protein, partial [Myxococcota bacterium]|nr:MCE family protein [Myxococcota bacterium]